MKKLLKKSIATVLTFSLVSSIYSESATIAFADMDNSTSSSSGKFEDANKNDINNEDESEGDSGHSGIVFDSYEKSEKELKSIREKKLAELEDNKGTYNENKIVLYNTNKSDAKMLAEKLGAKLRISFDNRFATLTLDKKNHI